MNERMTRSLNACRTNYSLLHLLLLTLSVTNRQKEHRTHNKEMSRQTTTSNGDHPHCQCCCDCKTYQAVCGHASHCLTLPSHSWTSDCVARPRSTADSHAVSDNIAHTDTCKLVFSQSEKTC